MIKCEQTAPQDTLLVRNEPIWLAQSLKYTATARAKSIYKVAFKRTLSSNESVALRAPSGRPKGKQYL